MLMVMSMKVNGRMIWLMVMVCIKNHVPVVVTQENVNEYGSVESAVIGTVVEAVKVCNELNRIRLIEINAIGFFM